jgi:hypothetical protein
MTTVYLERLRAANPVATRPAAGPPPVFTEVEQREDRSWRALVRGRRVGVLAFGVVVLATAAAVATAYAPSPWDNPWVARATSRRE